RFSRDWSSDVCSSDLADSQTDSSLVIGVRRAHSRSFGQATFRPIFHLDDLEAEPIVNLAVVQRLDRVVVRACDVSGSKQFFKAIGRDNQEALALDLWHASRVHVLLGARSEERRVGKECRSRWLKEGHT